jgi:hypothetical protein
MITMLLLVTDYGFWGRVCGRIVVMKDLVVVAPKFWSFSLHIFSQFLFYSACIRCCGTCVNIVGTDSVFIRCCGKFPQVIVKVRVDCTVRRIEFMVNNPRQKETMSMLFVELRTCRPFFALGDIGLFHCDNWCFCSGS